MSVANQSQIDLDLYWNLFVHRSDVFAQQQPNGAYYPVKRPLTKDDIQEHLEGWASYGVYVIKQLDPMQHQQGDFTLNTVKYVVFDLDTESEGALLYLIQSVESVILDTRCLLLEYSGRKGWHVWLFFSEPLPAARVRAWLEANFKFNHPLEIFPKQDMVEPGGYGNLVKLPLGAHAVSQRWSRFEPINGWAQNLEDVVPLPVSLIPESPVYQPDSGANRKEGGAAAASKGSGLISTPFPCVTKIMTEGAYKGCRDEAMFHLACFWRGNGLDQDLAEEQCFRTNELFDPPLTNREVKDKVKSAYSGRYETASCGKAWLSDFCEGGEACRGGWNVARFAPKDERFKYLG